MRGSGLQKKLDSEKPRLHRIDCSKTFGLINSQGLKLVTKPNMADGGPAAIG